MRRYVLVLLSSLFFFGCTMAQKDKNELKNVKLKDVSPFKIGVAIDPILLKSNSKYREIITNEFNSITPENSMKMNRLASKRGIYSWNEADEIVNFALKNGDRIHGHTLVWHRALPNWVTTFVGTKDDWSNLLKQYITDVVTHFKGKVAAWDVVNEAFEEDGSFRNSIWYQHLGEDYIRKAFEYAHEADPQALLFYNDFGQEWKSDLKRNAIQKFITKIKKQGVPIHGVGLQMHTNVFLKEYQIIDALTSMSSTGLRVHISELTLTVNPNRKNMQFRQDETSQKKQMEKFAEIIKLYKKTVPRSMQYGITVWNVGDADSYFPKQCNCKDYPQIFNANYQKKDYFGSIIKALKNDN